MVNGGRRTQGTNILVCSLDSEFRVGIWIPGLDLGVDLDSRMALRGVKTHRLSPIPPSYIHPYYLAMKSLRFALRPSFFGFWHRGLAAQGFAGIPLARARARELILITKVFFKRLYLCRGLDYLRFAGICVWTGRKIRLGLAGPLCEPLDASQKNHTREPYLWI
jgi:hypothetical protein